MRTHLAGIAASADLPAHAQHSAVSWSGVVDVAARPALDSKGARASRDEPHQTELNCIGESCLETFT